MSAALSIRLPDELVRRIEQLASQLDRPKTFLVRKALETYLDEHADCQIALDRLRDTDDDIISGAELRKRISHRKEAYR